MGVFSGLKRAWYGDKPKIIKEVVEDPYKTAISSPLSSYLARQVGQGLPRYTGDLQAPLDDATMSRYSEFMGLSASDLFEEAIGGPETRRFKEELLPEIREGYAGSLRGSGRYRAEEAGINKFSESLVAERAKFIPGITQAQIEAGFKKAEYEDIGKQREYTDWMKSLPEMNPVLDKALAFLAGPSGRDIIAGVDPGRTGWLKDLTQMTIDLVAAVQGSSRSGSAPSQQNVSGNLNTSFGSKTPYSSGGSVWSESLRQ